MGNRITGGNHIAYNPVVPLYISTKPCIRLEYLNVVVITGLTFGVGIFYGIFCLRK